MWITLGIFCSIWVHFCSIFVHFMLIFCYSIYFVMVIFKFFRQKNENNPLCQDALSNFRPCTVENFCQSSIEFPVFHLSYGTIRPEIRDKSGENFTLCVGRCDWRNSVSGIASHKNESMQIANHSPNDLFKDVIFSFHNAFEKKKNFLTRFISGVQLWSKQTERFYNKIATFFVHFSPTLG